MNIEEIVEYLKDFIEEDRLEQINLNRWFISSLLDYITNLQEENENLKELNVCVGCNNNPDYKSRNEKAIEYIIENNEDFKTEKYDCNTGDYLGTVLSIQAKSLLNILNGDEGE